MSIKVDSYAFESNVHFPTDLNLAWDCARKCIELTARLCQDNGLPGWRKHANWSSKIKGLCRRSARACRSGGKNKAERVETSVGAYLQSLYELEEKVLQSVEKLSELPMNPKLEVGLSELCKYHDLLIHHIFLISDRLLDGRSIDSSEKLYSVFEQYTEWIQKGKAHRGVELGRRLLIATDQYGIIHDYKIMEGGEEAAEVAAVADRLVNKVGVECIASLSFDRGFSSVKNRELLELCLDGVEVIMPKKGKLSAADRERQSQKKWRKLCGEHSAVESVINSLEHHGLDRCPDKGYAAYARYVGMGVMAYNLHRIGNHLLKKQNRVEDLARAA